MPDGVGIAVRPFPLHLFDGKGDAPHDFGPVLTPEQMAAKVPAGASPEAIDRAARQALDALVGCGPRQRAHHLDTALALDDGLARLRDFAFAGDAAAMRLLGTVLSRAVADLGALARHRPEIVREWSRTQNVVPVLTGKNAGHAEDLARDLAAFAVGEASPYKINHEEKRGGGTFNTNTPVNVLAGQLCQHLAWHRSIFPLLQNPIPAWARMSAVLPALTKATASKWADAAWECLMSATGSQPEKSSRLGKERASEGPGAERQKIRQSLREAIRRMACKPADVNNTVIASKT